MPFDLKHGAHIVLSEDKRAQELARTQENIKLEPSLADVVEEMTPFAYLFPDIVDNADNRLPEDNPEAVVAGLNALGSAMIDEATPPEEDSTIPPVYTYWGQFIDHDLTASTDRTTATSDITQEDLRPVPPVQVTESLKNLRRPALDLDSVYADGPAIFPFRPTEAQGFFDGAKFRIGTNATDQPPIPPTAEVPPPADDLARDLPRIGPLLDAGVIREDEVPESIREKEHFRFNAFIGDMRNDENLIVAQFHLAVLRFHNAAVDWIANHHSGYRNQHRLFRRARRLTRRHYQWLVVHDFLRTITIQGTVDRMLFGGLNHYGPRDGQLFMPLEFSVAAFRFGHSMVRAVYDHNRNFGRGANVLENSPFNLLFLFTGNGTLPNGTVQPFGGQGATLPFSWIIEWDRFIDKNSPFPDRFARKIDTRLAPPLADMVNEGNKDQVSERVRELLKHLARRNLLRGYSLSLPTGQAAANALGVTPLSGNELRQGNSDAINTILQENGFLVRTPLWYYILKESEVRANGNTLGEVGSRIVAETIVGLIVNDPDSFLNNWWTPARGVKLPNGDPIVTIGDFFRFAGVLA
jgi:Animal haem peroxidase